MNTSFEESPAPGGDSGTAHCDRVRSEATGFGDIDVSIVIPVFNADGSILELCSRVKQVLTGSDRSFELILVEDESRDQSWEVRLD